MVGGGRSIELRDSAGEEPPGFGESSIWSKNGGFAEFSGSSQAGSIPRVSK